MSRILAVGIATLDIINQVSHYPAEDDEVRALSQRQCRGGNATNTLTVLSQLDHQCHWAGVLIDEPDVTVIEQELAEYQIDTSSCERLAQGKMPTSYITISQTTGSRTIVHHRDCPEYSFDAFSNIDLTQFDWVHFEGRNVDQTLLMLKHLRETYPRLPCSLEIEKNRPDIDSLMPYASILMFSKQYALAQGHRTANDLLNSLPNNYRATCTWGEQGTWYLDRGKIAHCPAFVPSQIVDTLGAGDTFNAGLIDGLLRNDYLPQAVELANRLAGRKCGQPGFANLN